MPTEAEEKAEKLKRQFAKSKAEQVHQFYLERELN